MAALLPVDEALARVLDGVTPLEPEMIALSDAFGRVLAVDLVARRTQPPAAVSAMDGYAVRGDDVQAAPARLTVVGEVAAGHPFERRVAPGEAARIFTGGVMPAGTDTVAIQENARRDGNQVIFEVATATGKNVRPQGLDFSSGTTLLEAGRKLSARDIALAAAMNHAVLPVYRRPKLVLFATGDELVAPGAVPGPG